MKSGRKNTPSTPKTLLGKAYTIVPYEMLKWAFGICEKEKEVGNVLLALLYQCYHSDGYRTHLGVRMKCSRGEYVGSYKHLGQITGLTPYAAKKVVKEIIERSFISLRKINRGICIRFDAYLEFLDQYPHRDWKKENPPAPPANPLQGLNFPSENQLHIIDQLNNQHNEQK